jgi:hypothetical protein
MRKIYRTALFLLLALPMATALAAPMGYSVNSDQPLGDTLHTIDLATGNANAVGIGVILLGPPALSDIEGLAVAPDLGLWGVDEDSMTLFQIDTNDGTVVLNSEVTITGLDTANSNDFGLTFTCEGTLYATSVSSQSLYVLSETGNATRIGAAGSLGVNISAIASYGISPVKLYGLGNGLLGDEGPADNRSLYEIDLDEGTAAAIGEIGPAASDYDEAGLAFDAGGQLWAITDRSRLGQFSEVLRIDSNTGVATLQATTNVMGFESLAIAPPGNCVSAPFSPTDNTYPLPALGGQGKLLGILILLLTGFAGLRNRLF